MLASFLVISDLPDVICNIATYADDTRVLARPYLMMFFASFSVGVLKGIIHRKKQWIVLRLLEKVFSFSKGCFS